MIAVRLLALTLLMGGTAVPALATSTSTTPPTDPPKDLVAIQQDVVAIQPQPDGTTRIRIYSPAPGIASAALYASLKLDGVEGLQEPTASPMTVQDVFTCYWGTSYALQGGRCPP